ncbi:MAG: hypothetical protein Q8L87_18655, partial [Anaerolineales bacterium]|nr:hypothetical protein [Anaerolineales bacterium]
GEDFAETPALAHKSTRKLPQTTRIQVSSFRQNATPPLGHDGFRSGTKYFRLMESGKSTNGLTG